MASAGSYQRSLGTQVRKRAASGAPVNLSAYVASVAARYCETLAPACTLGQLVSVASRWVSRVLVLVCVSLQLGPQVVELV